MKRLLTLVLTFSFLTTFLAACTGSQAGGSSGSESSSPAVSRPLAQAVLAEPSYPEMAPYPDETAYQTASGDFDLERYQADYDAWQADREQQRSQPEGYQTGLNSFFNRHLSAFYSGDGQSNWVCSPLNLYLALGMLAEVTAGNSRAQILTALGAADLDDLRSQVDALWNANYCDDGMVTSRLANSLWLSQDLAYQKSTLEALAQYDYASSFRGKMGSANYNAALQDWLNEQTGGLLQEQARDITLAPETVLALASTLYYSAAWTDKFATENTTQDTFHSPAGDVTCAFLHQTDSGHYFQGSQFSAIAQHLESSGDLWLFRPEDGVTPAELLQDSQLQQLLQDGSSWEDSDYVTIHRSIPKFDVSASLDLKESLRELGITDLLDSDKADFSPLLQENQAGPVELSQAQHAARVVIDEEGCTAAAFTVISAEATAMPPQEEVSFVLDKPFLFVLTGEDGAPLFVGIVNQP